ncbi:MAG: Cys-tRNA(Pro) deacylase [Propionibacteriaceae bacterium]|jgi:Cys-tRNA(Pro)/Cys-tRNA(Cys) deacylase|nr:Cys-tRNA(Pro) deacylase [Propionibacteriaceae bacterium]
MSKKPAGTPALKALDAAGVEYSIHEYEHDPRSKVGFGLESVEKLGMSADQSFKTLMVLADGELCCAVVPSSGMLNLKEFAKALGAKKAELADPAQAQRETGYIVGGISPLGQKKKHRTVIDESAELFDKVYVSGGRRGLTVGLAPGDLVKLTGAAEADIARQL